MCIFDRMTESLKNQTQIFMNYSFDFDKIVCERFGTFFVKMTQSFENGLTRSSRSFVNDSYSIKMLENIWDGRNIRDWFDPLWFVRELFNEMSESFANEICVVREWFNLIWSESKCLYVFFSRWFNRSRTTYLVWGNHLRPILSIGIRLRTILWGEWIVCESNESFANDSISPDENVRRKSK